MTPSAFPILDTCDGCGACCLEQGALPDYVALRLNPQFAADPGFADDAARLASLPGDAVAALDGFLHAVAIGTAASNGVCVWYEGATQRCRFYEHRPSTCRVFERNSPGCHIYRRRHGFDAGRQRP
jgi:Fe-S-cluster containining protein